MNLSSGEALGTEAAQRLAHLAQSGRGECRIERGLTEAEFVRIEVEFGFEFADDHRAFLAAGLPVSVPHDDLPGVISAYREPWPDWRDGDSAKLRERVDWPRAGVLFDVEHNAFWDDSWGPRPSEIGPALENARRGLAAVPTLVPVYGHRYLPAGRGNHGHPVLSVWQTDIIYYGLDLADYIDREFGTSDTRDASWNPRASVEFWRDFL